MRKSLIAIFLIIFVSAFTVYALDGFSFSAGIGYDLRSVKEFNTSLHSMEIDLGAKYPIGNGFNIYSDLGFRFVGGGKIEGTENSKDLLGVTLRSGVLYGMRFVSNPAIEAYVGGGLTIASTRFVKTTTSIYNAGIGFKLVAAYRVRENWALAFSVMPDVYFFNKDQFKLGFGCAATAGALFKF